MNPQAATDARRARAERVFASLPRRPRGADLIDFRPASEQAKAIGAQLAEKACRALGKDGKAAA